MENLVRQVVDFIFSKGKNKLRFIDDIVKMPSELDRKRRVEKFKFSSFTTKGNINEKMNFFPSIIKGRCHNLAVFVSMREETLSFKSDPNNFVSLDVVLKKMVHQVLGSCFNVNKEVVLITDTIDTKVIEEWKPNLRAMTKVCDKIRFYYVDREGTLKDVSFLFI